MSNLEKHLNKTNFSDQSNPISLSKEKLPLPVKEESLIASTNTNSSTGEIFDPEILKSTWHNEVYPESPRPIIPLGFYRKFHKKAFKLYESDKWKIPQTRLDQLLKLCAFVLKESNSDSNIRGDFETNKKLMDLTSLARCVLADVQIVELTDGKYFKSSQEGLLAISENTENILRENTHDTGSCFELLLWFSASAVKETVVRMPWWELDESALRPGVEFHLDPMKAQFPLQKNGRKLSELSEVLATPCMPMGTPTVSQSLKDQEEGNE